MGKSAADMLLDGRGQGSEPPEDIETPETIDLRMVLLPRSVYDRLQQRAREKGATVANYLAYLIAEDAE